MKFFSSTLAGMAALSLLATLAFVPAFAFAGGRSSLPPDVDLDPDRGMSFGRLPKTSFDRRVFEPMKRSLTSQAMDPAIDPYNPVVRPSRYEPGTGKIRDSYTDQLREVRRREEQSRKSRAALARESSNGAARAARVPAYQPSRSSTSKKSDD
jgi:hypothetical protein